VYAGRACLFALCQLRSQARLSNLGHIGQVVSRQPGIVSIHGNYVIKSATVAGMLELRYDHFVVWHSTKVYVVLVRKHSHDVFTEPHHHLPTCWNHRGCNSFELSIIFRLLPVTSIGIGVNDKPLIVFLIVHDQSRHSRFPVLSQLWHTPPAAVKRLTRCWTICVNLASFIYRAVFAPTLKRLIQFDNRHVFAAKCAPFTRPTGDKFNFFYQPHASWIQIPGEIFT